jgi:hypothetical protein
MPDDGAPEINGLPEPVPEARRPFAALRPDEWRRLFTAMRPLPVLFGIAYLIQRADSLPDRVIYEADRERGIQAALATRGLGAREEDIHFVTPTRPLLTSPVVHERAIVRAQRRREPADIYLVDARRSPEGHLIDIAGIYNLTSTSAADEQQLVVSGDRAAWVITQDGAASSVQYADVRGEPRPQGAEWTRFRRFQNAITNYQDSGQFRGVWRRSFKLEPPAYKVVLGFSSSALLIDADAHKIRIPTGSGHIEGEEYVRDQTPFKARPGNLVTWAVDRVRGIPWFGDESLQFVKAVAFEGVDQFEQIVNTVTGDDGAAAVAEELGTLYSAPKNDATDPETGWPPPAMEPMLDPPLKGEGKWASLADDPYVAKNVGAPTPFVFSFIRTDRKRMYSQVFVTLWDPRQIDLHMVSGTVEPKSATGETGTGLVPRTEAVLSRFVAAFNGGFQTVHGEFGMMAERVAYLPPKPYGATVARLTNGSTAFGTWPENNTRVPDNIDSYRQNMTPLIVDEHVNPYKRHWWGGVPPGWTEESRTVRSGVCMTTEGFVGYFYGGSVDPDVLALAMQRAHCSYGVHLDMNAGHTGLEFYRLGRAGTLPKLGRRLDESWEAEGPVPDMPGWNFMGRRMIKFMALMNFPRYVNAESRDFFYLTLRHLLPGEPAPTTGKGVTEGEGSWRTQGLPQHGWPDAVATTNVHPDAARPYARVGLIKIDPKVVRIERSGDVAPQRILEFRSLVSEGSTALWHSETLGFVIAPKPPEAKALRVTAGFVADADAGTHAQAALGVDAAGMLIYARVTEGPEPGHDGALLLSLLSRMTCTSVMLLPKPLGAILSTGEASPSGEVTDGVVLIRAEGPGARRIFPDTPIVGPKRWAPLQQKRVQDDVREE